MNIFGDKIKRAELLKKIGDISQLGGIKSYQFDDGLSKGIRAVDMKSPSGLDLTVLLDRGMDISNLSYKSIPISWRSATRETSPVYYESRGLELLRSFYGGLFTTCGLTYVGSPCIDNEEELGLHGRISNLAAENVWADGKWVDDNYVMWVQGKVREAKMLYYKLELNRKITIWMDSPSILVEDTIENIGPEKTPFMILYHVNIGYPIVNSTSKLLSSKTKITPMDEISEKELNKYSDFQEPVSGFISNTYYHDIEPDKEGNSNIAIVNEDFNQGQGMGIWLKYNKDSLPYLVQWKHMGEGEYICGIEPSNTLLRGRDVEREKGTLKFLNPGEKVKNRLEFKILTSNEDIEIFKNYIK